MECGQFVFQHKVAKGMSKEACRESIGKPMEVKVTEKDISYKYKDRIVVFDGQTGLVSSIIDLK